MPAGSARAFAEAAASLHELHRLVLDEGFHTQEPTLETRFLVALRRIEEHSSSEQVRARCRFLRTVCVRAFAAPSHGHRAELVDALLMLTIDFEQSHRDAINLRRGIW